MFNRETFVIVKCAVVVVGPGTDKQLPVPQFRGLEWRGGGFPSTCRPVSKTSLRGESLVGKRRRRKESVPKSCGGIEITFTTSADPFLLRRSAAPLFSSAIRSSFFPAEFSPACTVKAARRKEDGIGMGGGMKLDRKKIGNLAVVPLLPAKIPLITWKELICVYSARLRGSKKKISTIQV